MKIKVFAPSTVANVACGFDIMGFAINQPGDILTVETNNDNILIINNNTPFDLPLQTKQNVTSIALLAMLCQLQSNQGFTLTFEQKIPMGSGIGSSAASSVAGVFAANELLGRPFTRKQLVTFALEGEKFASGGIHADNVAPSLLGGFVLIRSYEPLDLISIPYPESTYCVVFHQNISLPTKEMRKVLPTEIPLKQAIKQWGNVAGLVAGLTTNNIQLISNSLTDYVAEPVRAPFIPEFYKIKQTALKSGALGCSISGSGPSVFALCENEFVAGNVAQAIENLSVTLKLNGTVYKSAINKQGCYVIKN